MTKILLINPPSELKNPVLPLGLASIAAYLQEKQVDVSVIDAWAEKLSFNKLSQQVTQNQADIIGIYMLSPRYDQAKKTIEVCRQSLPNSIIVAGGPHTSAMPIETLNEIPELDVCVIGEGEKTMYELTTKKLSEVNGIAYRNKNGKLVLTQLREYIKDLDNLPFPSRDLFPLEKYKPAPPMARKESCYTMITSRGCPYQCTYCSKDVFKDVYRTLSPKRVCDEIEELITKYKAEEIPFLDDDFSMNIKRAEAICDEIIKRKLKFRWSCSTRVDQVNEQLLKKMKQAGCWLICYGVESGNQKILNSINKGFTIDQVISSFEMTRKIGILTLSSFMVGLPNETKETIQETFNLVKKIKPNFISCSMLMVFPGSRLFKLIKSGKYQGKLKVLKKEERIPGVFLKGNYIAFENNLTFEELKKIIQKITRDFYLRPQYIIQFIKTIKSFSDFKYYLKGALKVLKSVI